MDPSRFDRLFRTLGTATGRRTLLQSAAALSAAVVSGTVLPDAAAAKRLCRKNGSKCKKKGKKCKAKFCLRAPLLQTPFTIEARWSNTETDHDTFLFVPDEEGTNKASPFIRFNCNPGNSDCENDVYPFACVGFDATGPGDEITTVHRLLDGTYEYWIELDHPSPPADLEVILRNGNGSVVRSWSSPENANSQHDVGWHVFDLTIAGARHSITSVDELTDNTLPVGAHNPNTDVCPKVP
jgi:hypothetical protein